MCRHVNTFTWGFTETFLPHRSLQMLGLSHKNINENPSLEANHFITELPSVLCFSVLYNMLFYFHSSNRKIIWKSPRPTLHSYTRQHCRRASATGTAQTHKWTHLPEQAFLNTLHSLSPFLHRSHHNTVNNIPSTTLRTEPDYKVCSRGASK